MEVEKNVEQTVNRKRKVPKGKDSYLSFIPQNVMFLSVIETQ